MLRRPTPQLILALVLPAASTAVRAAQPEDPGSPATGAFRVVDGPREIVEGGAPDGAGRPETAEGFGEHMRAPVDEWNALDKYVARPDPAFAWEVLGSESRGGVTTYLLRLTSQRWREEGEVSHPLWTHDLRVSVPETRRGGLAVLYINGGTRPRGEDRPAEIDNGIASAAAGAVGLVVASVNNVPSQPLGIRPELRVGRYEDDIVAESWDRALETGDLTWAVQLPMVKAAVAAMDAVEEFLATLDEPVEVQGFGVTGASKRGWTTWLTAAVDNRVEAIAPLVIPILNMGPNFRHHYAAYGFFAAPLHDYERRGLAERLGTPEFERLTALVDPYAYRLRLTMPKYVVSAASDEFFVTDSERFYYADLPGENRLWVAARAGHNITVRGDAVPSVLSWFGRVADGLEAGDLGPTAAIPELEWERKGEELTVRVLGGEPAAAYLWRAENRTARDFRTDTIGGRPGRGWTATLLEPDADGAYRVPLTAPEAGWTAIIAEFTFAARPGIDGRPGTPPLLLSTPAIVVPDDLPFATKPLAE